MNFIEAVKLGVENGKKIKRDYWTCLYISFVDYGNELVINTGKESREKYIPTTTDIIANDWEIYEEKPKTVNFQEAFKALKDGKIISRVSNEIQFYITGHSTEICKKYYANSPSPSSFREWLNLNSVCFSHDDIVATDWIILD